MSRGPRVYVGTSGWSYGHWEGAFYPAGAPKKDALKYYATQFPSVEINFTFYRLAHRAAVKQWARAVPERFVFAIKGSRFISHMKRLNQPKRPLRRFFAPLKPLQGKAGPVLWQLPPSFLPREHTLRLLSEFLDALPAAYRYAFEFRDPSWLDHPPALELLRAHRAALVWVSSKAMPPKRPITADFVYLRFHGLSGGAHHDYTEAELLPWARALRRCGLPAFAYFNNDLNPHVAANARLLERLLNGAAVVVPGADPLRVRRGSTWPRLPDVWPEW